MTTERVAAWLLEHSSVPQTVVKPVATKLGISTNYLGAALFAGQLVYENQETVVRYANKGSVTVGEFLHERSRDRYGEDHPLTEHLRANLDAITEAFEGSEEEALTFAEFYRQFRAVDRERHLTDEIDATGNVRDAVADLDAKRLRIDPERLRFDPELPPLDETFSDLPELREKLPDSRPELPDSRPELPASPPKLPEPDSKLSELGGKLPGGDTDPDAEDTDPDADEAVEIPVTEDE